MTIEYYIIRHKPTGNIMPIRDRWKGNTRMEPVPINSTKVPRLFRTKKNAQDALTWWLKGITTVRLTTSYDGDCDEDWRSSQPDNPRLAHEMEIIPINILIP